MDWTAHKGGPGQASMISNLNQPSYLLQSSEEDVLLRIAAALVIADVIDLGLTQFSSSA